MCPAFLLWWRLNGWSAGQQHWLVCKFVLSRGDKVDCTSSKQTPPTQSVLSSNRDSTLGTTARGGRSVAWQMSAREAWEEQVTSNHTTLDLNHVAAYLSTRQWLHRQIASSYHNKGINNLWPMLCYLYQVGYLVTLLQHWFKVTVLSLYHWTIAAKVQLSRQFLYFGSSL